MRWIVALVPVSQTDGHCSTIRLMFLQDVWDLQQGRKEGIQPSFMNGRDTESNEKAASIECVQRQSGGGCFRVRREGEDMAGQYRLGAAELK